MWCFCHTSARIGHRYTCVPSLLNPAQASDDLPPPLPPPPQGQASLARGPVLQRALMRPRPGVCSVSFPCPSLQLGKTTLIFSSFFSFFFFRKKHLSFKGQSVIWYYLLDLFRERHKRNISNPEITRTRPKSNWRGILRHTVCLLFVSFIYNIFTWGGSREEMVTPSQSLKSELSKSHLLVNGSA